MAVKNLDFGRILGGMDTFARRAGAQEASKDYAERRKEMDRKTRSVLAEQRQEHLENLAREVEARERSKMATGYGTILGDAVTDAASFLGGVSREGKEFGEEGAEAFKGWFQRNLAPLSPKSETFDPSKAGDLLLRYFGG
jgi:predicted phage gp36 major capsid-like protein